MPASLSNQIRLGFSLGWRIWTPNEVGFYAKTLAHSYFIFTILKAKFFTKKLWVVNYSIFIAAAKYLVFVEFIEFGIKTKEERTYWKKIMYISLLIRHAKYKSKLKYTPNFEKMKTIGRFFRKLAKKKRNKELRPKIWTYFKKMGNSAIKRRDEKEIHKKTFEILSKTLAENKNLNLKFYRLNQRKKAQFNAVSENKKSYRKRVKSFFKREYVAAGLRQKIMYKWNSKSFPKDFEILNKKQKAVKVLSRKIGKIWFRKRTARTILKKKSLRPIANFDTITEVLGRKQIKTNKKKQTVRFPISLQIARVWRLDIERRKNVTRSLTVRKSVDSETRLKDRAELIFAFQSYIQKRFGVGFSITGGPRKRLFRNIKRNFQGKFIVHYTSLVWFWEKISKLITYMVKRLTDSYFKISE